MLPSETSTLLELVRAVDGREVTEATVVAWHDVVGHLDLAVARAALREARANPTYKWLEPHHLIIAAAVIERRMEHDERATQAKAITGTGVEHYGAPRPKNLKAMEAAWNDPAAFRAEVVLYEEQLEAEGYSDRWVESGRVCPPQYQ